jgi:transposase
MKKAHDFPKILLCRAACDMRKQAYGLAEVVEGHMKETPFENCLFLFCNRRRDIIKALYFDRAGFCLWTKKLDQGRFPWARQGVGVELEVSADDLCLIFEGVDVFKRHKSLDLKSIS